MNSMENAGLHRDGSAARSTAGARSARYKFVARAALVICGIAAGALLGWGGFGAPAKAAQADSAAVNAQMITYPSESESISAYIAKPKSGGKHAAVLIVHDSGGLNDSVEDVTRRFASAGFVALAPNLVSRTTDAKTPSQIYSAIGKIPLTVPVGDLKAALSFLRQDSSVDSSKISVIGIGWGGWRAYKLAEESPNLYRIVVFYGVTPYEDDLGTKIHAPILMHYAQYDFHVTGGALTAEKEIGKNFKYYVYAKADRGFFVVGGSNSPEPTDGDVAAAKLSWTRTLDFLK